MHSTISPIATAQTRYAIGAAAPSEPATLAGRRKMPPPMVMLMIPAASPNMPIARTRGSPWEACDCESMARSLSQAAFGARRPEPGARMLMLLLR